jgi:hypothetical protein
MREVLVLLSGLVVPDTVRKIPCSFQGRCTEQSREMSALYPVWDRDFRRQEEGHSLCFSLLPGNSRAGKIATRKAALYAFAGKIVAGVTL